MKIIVNRKQYDKLIKESRGYSKTVEKWADYVTDQLLPSIMDQDVEEDVYLLTKLSLKLKGKDFYEELQKVCFHPKRVQRYLEEFNYDLCDDCFYYFF